MQGARCRVIRGEKREAVPVLRELTVTCSRCLKTVRNGRRSGPDKGPGGGGGGGGGSREYLKTGFLTRVPGMEKKTNHASVWAAGILYCPSYSHT